MGGLRKMLFGGSKYTPPPASPTAGGAAVSAAGKRAKRKAAIAKGRASTLLTGGMGVRAPAAIGTTELLGR